MEKKIQRIISCSVKLLMILVLSYLSFLSMISTSYLDRKEHIMFLSDRPVNHIIFLIIILVLVILARQSLGRKKSGKSIKRLYRGLFLLYAVICFVWVCSTQMGVKADQGKVLLAAEKMVHNDYSSFLKGGYAYTYPDQIGIILIFYVITLISGTRNILFIQGINIVCLLLLFWIFKRIYGLLLEAEELVFSGVLLQMAFLPSLFYITFVYGNIMGLLASVSAIYFIMKYYKEEKRTRYLIESAVCISLAVLIKSNYLIILIALIILIFFQSVFEKDYKRCAIPLLFIGSFLLLQSLSSFTLYTITGVSKSNGVPKVAWVAMGLQDGRRAPGWYNGYNVKIYKKNGYNGKLASEYAKEDIEASLQRFNNHPRYAMKFFNEKIASMWSEPSFGSLWINYNRESKIKMPVWARFFIFGKGNSLLILYMNYMQSFLYIGALCYFLYRFKENDFLNLIWAICFLGGFIFHLFWEAKGQYTFTYVLCLIGYTSQGYMELCWSLLGMGRELKTEGFSWRAIRNQKVAVCLAIFFLVVGSCTSLQPLKKFNSNDLEYTELIKERDDASGLFEKKKYAVSPWNDKNRVLVTRDDTIRAKKMKPKQGRKRVNHGIQIIHTNGYYYLRFGTRGQFLGRTKQENNILLSNFTGKEQQHWYIRKASQNGYYIYSRENEYLTYNRKEKTISLSKKCVDSTQIWRIESIKQGHEL